MMIRALERKLESVAQRQPLASSAGRNETGDGCMPVSSVASLTGRAQFLFLAIKPARYYLREVHDVLRTKDSTTEAWFILDTNDMPICARYIKTTANIRADWLRRENDYNNWAFNIIHFKYLDSIGDRYIINRFASMENARFPRYNSCWSAPCSEATDSLSYAFTATACDVASTPGVSRPHCTIDGVVIKLHTSGEASTVIARHWPYKSWHQRLSEMRS
eukprot:jgi/Tetstr1/456981/TSEL_043646.t1